MLRISSLSSFLYIPVASPVQITDDNRTVHFFKDLKILNFSTAGFMQDEGSKVRREC